MKQQIEKYSGVIFFYSVIVFGILALNIRFKYLNEMNLQENNIISEGARN